MLGRVFSAEDGQLNAAKTVVLSYRIWMRRFGGDASVVGKTLNTDGGTTVIGVMPMRLSIGIWGLGLWLIEIGNCD